MRALIPALVILTLAASGYGADQAVLGRKLAIKDSKPGIDPTKRKIVGDAKELTSPTSLTGDLVNNGAVLTLFAEGTSPGSQVFNLAAGTDPATGKPFWSNPSGSKFTYKDKAGTNSAVK